jgi:RecJ-like exonuclease
VDAARDLNNNPHQACALCSGSGVTNKMQCPACFGKGSVLVEDPIVKCPPCGGSGMITDDDMGGSYVCKICSGTGWLLPLRG